MDKKTITVGVNGVSHTRSIEPRLLLSDFIRCELGLTGTHVGCEHGVCGACTVILDGRSARSCLTLAVQADGMEIETVEGQGTVDSLGRIQEAFRQRHGLQCGFCTPGVVMAVHALLDENRDASEDEVRDVLGGQLCRCTGYHSILRSAMAAADDLRRGAGEAR